MIQSLTKEELAKQAALAKTATIQRKKVALSIAGVALASFAFLFNRRTK